MAPVQQREAWVKPEKVNEQTRTTKFRSIANRIVPYKEVPIAGR